MGSWQRQLRTFLLYTAIIGIVLGGLGALALVAAGRIDIRIIARVIASVFVFSAFATVIHEIAEKGRRLKEGRMSGVLLASVVGTAVFPSIRTIAPSTYYQLAGSGGGRVAMNLLLLGFLVLGAIFGPRIPSLKRADERIYGYIDATRDGRERSEPSLSAVLARLKRYYFPQGRGRETRDSR